MVIRKIIIIVLVFSILFSVTVTANINKKNYGKVVVKKVTSVYDGDTFRCNMEGWPAIIGERIRIRIAGVDTPEMGDRRFKVRQQARKAKQFTVRKLRNAKKIELRNMRRGKYFRVVADVFVDGEDLGEVLVKSMLAVNCF